MSCVLIIPSYWGRQDNAGPDSSLSCYDRVNSLGSKGSLYRCLSSLRDTGIDCSIMILAVAQEGLESETAAWIRRLCSDFPSLDTLVIGADQERAIHGRLAELGYGAFVDAASFKSPGAIRNLGILAAAALGFEQIIFLGEDCMLSEADFLQKAGYALGKITPGGLPIFAKTGFYLDRRGSYRAWAPARIPWCERKWRQAEAFNQWMDAAMLGPRLCASNVACGSCMALHKDAFSRLSFDPWIARGEDLDYLLSLRMYGFELWFDNQWSLRRLPAENPDAARIFEEDMSRWIYELRKLEYGRTQIDLLPLRREDLEPYPAPFVFEGLNRRLLVSALRRGLVLPGHLRYLEAASLGRMNAKRYAMENCRFYFSLQNRWPGMVSALWNDYNLADQLLEERSAPSMSAQEAEDNLSRKDVGRIADRWEAAAQRRNARSSQTEQSPDQHSPDH